MNIKTITRSTAKVAAAGAILLALTGCTSAGNLDPNAGVTVVGKEKVPTTGSNVMVAGESGMEYQPITTAGGYNISVQHGGSTYDVAVDEHCYNTVNVGAVTNVASLQNDCGNSLSPMVRAPR